MEIRMILQIFAKRHPWLLSQWYNAYLPGVSAPNSFWGYFVRVSPNIWACACLSAVFPGLFSFFCFVTLVAYIACCTMTAVITRRVLYLNWFYRSLAIVVAGICMSCWSFDQSISYIRIYTYNIHVTYLRAVMLGRGTLYFPDCSVKCNTEQRSIFLLCTVR